MSCDAIAKHLQQQQQQAGRHTRAATAAVVVTVVAAAVWLLHLAASAGYSCRFLAYRPNSGRLTTRRPVRLWCACLDAAGRGSSSRNSSHSEEVKGAVA
eukprot:16993-Heterococcus_DN1.PRE.1